MFFEPLASWIVSLFALGNLWVDEKTKNDNVRVSPKPPRHPEPHRNPKTGQIMIENTLLYKEDLKKHGAYQTMQWAREGKYNLSPEELKNENMRIQQELKKLYKL